jgi:hypothetical protein
VPKGIDEQELDLKRTDYNSKSKFSMLTRSGGLSISSQLLMLGIFLAVYVKPMRKKSKPNVQIAICTAADTI